MCLILNNIIIETREDGFINATQLCKAGGKVFKDWHRLNSTKELIKELDKESGWIYSWHPNDVNLVNKDWLNYPLYYQGHKFEKNLEKCPTLKNILEKKSDIINLAGLSLMRPRSRLPYHKDMTGPTYGSMAYHLGINVPDGSYLYVKKKKINEQNAKSIIFNSEYLHAAENESFEDRIILYIDFKII